MSRPLHEQVRERIKRPDTISAVAERAGVAQPNLSKWLRGEPSLGWQAVQRVLNALGLELRVVKMRAKHVGSSDEEVGG